jgi:hypothetical protein
MVNMDITQIRVLMVRHFDVDGSFTIDPVTGVVDVKGHMIMKSYAAQSPTFSQLPVQFGHVTGDFWCEFKDLTTLMGAPDHVGGSFRCEGNDLTTLEGAPTHVGGRFKCSTNKLVSLKGGPKTVLGTFDCEANLLTNLIGAPEHVGQDFACPDNPLKSLQGAPDQINDQMILEYSPGLPVLRTLVAKRGCLLLNAPAEIRHILNDVKFKGQGKAAAIACAAELVRAGFKGNARW